MTATESGWFSQGIALIGAQREGSRARRAAFVCWICVPVYLLFAFWSLGGWFIAVEDPSLDGKVLSYATLYGFTMTLAWVAAAVYGLQLDHLARPDSLYSRLVLVGYAITTALTCYLVGTLNIICGLVMMGAPLLGMMLFPIREIVVLFALAILAVLGASVASALGAIPYAPILSSGLLSTSAPGLYYAMSGIVGSAIYVTYEAFIMAALVSAAREREADTLALSMTDALTGVANRQHIIETLRRRLLQGSATGSGLSIVMVDVAGLRDIGITQGQRLVDETVVATANALRSCLRSRDIIGRLHDDAFLVILPDTPQAAAEEVARRCRESVAESAGAVLGNTTLLTVRTGLASCTGLSIVDADELMRVARPVAHSL